MIQHLEQDQVLEWLMTNHETDQSVLQRASTTLSSSIDDIDFGLAKLPESDFDDGTGMRMTDIDGNSLVAGNFLGNFMTHVWTGDGWQELLEPVAISQLLH